jgi:hypothetical protein
MGFDLETELFPIQSMSVYSSARFLLTIVRYAWASPNTSLGLVIGGLGMFTGSRAQMQRSCIEFHGGRLIGILQRLPPHGAQAITLGHTIIGIDISALEHCRNHEHVHVRQYEKWGPFFIPAYLSCSAYLWFRNRDYYRENPFEVEAFANDRNC